MTKPYKDILIHTTDLYRIGVPAAGNFDSVEGAMGEIYMRLSSYANQSADGVVDVISPHTNEAFGHGRVWSIAWVGGHHGWAEAYAVSEGASNNVLTTFALTPCVLAVEALD